MDSYNFVKEDWESIMEVGQFEGKRKLLGDINSKVSETDFILDIVLSVLNCSS